MELRVCTTDDFTYTIIIRQIANTIKKINIFGVYYILNTTSSLQKNQFKNESRNDGIFDVLFLIQIAFNVTKNTKDGKDNALYLYKFYFKIISKYINATKKINKEYYRIIQNQYLSSYYLLIIIQKNRKKI